MNRAPSLPLSRPPSLSRWSVLALLGVFALTLGACSDATPIDEARALETGEEVTVEGHVSVQPGAFVSALGDEGFALQDDTGGIYVKLDPKQTFGLGAHVRVTGTLDEQNQLRILKAVAADVKVLSGTQLVSAKDVTTGGVNESVEGQLISVSGAITQAFVDDSPYGYKLYINDGTGEVQVFVHVSAGFDKAALQELTVGQRLRVVGLAAQYETTYEVAPRMPADLSVLP
ncbi:DNA-binding protein [Corallococcus praedator]|uniref:DNA-binding protein n=1 Tax=Corallococcus praedator TaxID=2316724 RepID=A0ABX9Q940_9BACT|nr:MULTISPECIES: DNA-binding protein [Corallococcus]RKG99997.1 DNA-binding protein [Corallococcus sp. CA047B]RKH19273.1 DNA-binding protein [Corallococcus sp. CA031C]RKH92249.1 DNA-binding protein [Corallococcus praedator]